MTVKGNYPESMKARVVDLKRGTSSRPVLHSCEVSWVFKLWSGHDIAPETIKGK